MDNCGALDREKGKLYVCDLPLHHLEDHQDGDRTWPVEKFTHGERVKHFPGESFGSDRERTFPY